MCLSEKLLVVTVATKDTDGFRRFLRSAKHFNYTVKVGKVVGGSGFQSCKIISAAESINPNVSIFKVLGRDEKWNGGNYMGAPGGGQKVRLLKSALEEMKNQDKIILFTDR